MTTEDPETGKRKVKLGSRRCQCAACGEYFNSVPAFDRHRVGPYTDRWCLSSFAMEALGMSQREDGIWVLRKFDSEADGRLKTAALRTRAVG